MGRVSWIIWVWMGLIQSHEFLKAETLSQWWSERDVVIEKESERQNVTDFEDGGKGLEPRKAGSLWELGKAGEWVLLRTSGKECKPTEVLILAQQGTLSDLQNYKTINPCCVKPLVLWQFVTTAVGSEYR